MNEVNSIGAEESLERSWSFDEGGFLTKPAGINRAELNYMDEVIT